MTKLRCVLSMLLSLSFAMIFAPLPRSGKALPHKPAQSVVFPSLSSCVGPALRQT